MSVLLTLAILFWVIDFVLMMSSDRISKYSYAIIWLALIINLLCNLIEEVF